MTQCVAGEVFVLFAGQESMQEVGKGRWSYFDGSADLGQTGQKKSLWLTFPELFLLSL